MTSSGLPTHNPPPSTANSHKAHPDKFSAR